MNKTKWRKYIEDGWSMIPELCIEPSEALVRKWKPIMDYKMDSFQHTIYDPMFNIKPNMGVEHTFTGPMYSLPPVDKKDRLKASYIFEIVEQCYIFNGATDKLKWVMINLRGDMTKIPPLKKRNNRLIYP
jgi:hypothetical protein